MNKAFKYPEIDTKATGARLKELMRENGISNTELAKLLYSTPTAVGKWRTGARIISIRDMLALSRLFEIPVEDIVMVKQQGYSGE